VARGAWDVSTLARDVQRSPAVADHVDIALRSLATRHLTRLLPGLLAGRRVEHLRVERAELPQVIERRADDVVRARVDGVETILHTEFQQRHYRGLPLQALVYNALLRQRHDPTPVLTLVVYLMPRPPRRPIPRGIEPTKSNPQLTFCYEVFCPWERAISIEEVARCPALAPLAVLTPAIGARDLRQLAEAVERSALDREEAGDLLAVTYLVGGCRFGASVLQSLKRSGAMEHSTTYQLVFKEGEARGEARGRAEGEARGRAEGEARGRAEGEARALRRSIAALVRTRLGVVPSRLERRLDQLDAPALDLLFTRLLEAASPTAVRKLLPR